MWLVAAPGINESCHCVARIPSESSSREAACPPLLIIWTISRKFMKGVPDVAASLFTNDYRDVKLKGKPPRKQYPGTGSCFDATDFGEVRDLYKKHAQALPDKDKLPVWDKASCTYRCLPQRKGPQDFMKAGTSVRNGSQLSRQLSAHSTPPPAGAFKARVNLPDTHFRKAYERADLPIAVEHRASKNVIKWKADIAELDYMHMLPLFLDGLREIQDPFRFLAVQGCEDLLEAGGDRILPALPFCIPPLKRALSTRDKQVMIITLRILQKLVLSAELIGQALVPYYRQLLPICNLYARCNENMGDSIDYAQREGNCLGEVVSETLQLLELHGGPDAFINIKYLVPIYESALAC